jgi:ABC-type sugar transport system substrate-binding protein
MKRLAVIALAALLAISVFTTGQASAADKPIRITIILKNLVNPFWISVREGALKAARENNVTLTVLAPTVADNNEEQIGELEQTIVKREDAIVLIPADSVGIVPGVEKANEAHIPIISVNTSVNATSSSARVETFIAVENYDAASAVAEKLAEKMNKEGDVIILEGTAGSSSSADIVRGAKDTFAKFPKIRVVASQTAQYQRVMAMTVTQNLLQAHPNAKAIFSANDEMAMGALEAVSQAGKEGKILISGLDGNADSRAAVDAGRLALTCDKRPFEQGYEGVIAAVKFLKGEKLAPRIKIETTLYEKGGK